MGKGQGHRTVSIFLGEFSWQTKPTASVASQWSPLIAQWSENCNILVGKTRHWPEELILIIQAPKGTLYLSCLKSIALFVSVPWYLLPVAGNFDPYLNTAFALFSRPYSGTLVTRVRFSLCSLVSWLEHHLDTKRLWV